MKGWQQHHAHLGLEFLVRNSTESEHRELLTKMERLPFMWAAERAAGTSIPRFSSPLSTTLRRFSTSPKRW